jgi:molybdenum cofactor cytidylyltransferase
MKSASNRGLRIAVLAAGRSCRLGRPKALVRVRSVGLLRRTVALLAPLTGSTILVIAPPRCARFRADLRGLPATIVANGRRLAGLSSSVRLAVERSTCATALMLVPVDLPALKRSEVLRLIARWRPARRAVVARGVAGRGRTPLILPKRLFRAARSITGDRGLRDFVDGLPRGQLMTVEIPSAAADVDTPQDLSRARRRFY